MHLLAERFVFWRVMIEDFWKESRPIKRRQCRLLTRQLFSVFTSIVYGDMVILQGCSVQFWVRLKSILHFQTKKKKEILYIRFHYLEPTDCHVLVPRRALGTRPPDDQTARGNVPSTRRPSSARLVPVHPFLDRRKVGLPEKPRLLLGLEHPRRLLAHLADHLGYLTRAQRKKKKKHFVTHQLLQALPRWDRLHE